jgi:predicted MFS family arabinose efflux permease
MGGIFLDSGREKSVKIFLAIIALTGLALGLSDGVLSNYFKDAYQADAIMRGIIEIPRETPGVLCVLAISAFAFLGDMRLSIIAQIMSLAGLLVLGFVTPPFAVMLIFLFINSMGMHMFMPLSDSTGMSLAEEGKFGSMMGRINGVRTIFTMIAGLFTFFGFRFGLFSFKTPIKATFLIAAAAFAVVIALLVALLKKGGAGGKMVRPRFVIRKEYTAFYIMAILFGARKQIMFVYAPWVLIELLGFEADNMSLLAIAGAAIGIFFLPAVGRWIDRYGTKRIMMIEAAFFFVIYIAYGVISAGLSAGWLVGLLPVILALVINVLDRMTIQFGMVRSVYMRSIAKFPEDVTPTLSIGMALDHIVSVLGAIVCGFLWENLGPQYVFGMAAVMAVCNMIVALRIKSKAA